MLDDELEDVIIRCGLGDRAALRALHDATAPKLLGLAMRVLKDRAEAEDAMQDAFVKIWQNADRFAATGNSPMAWLVTIARNAAIDRLRRRRVQPLTGQGTLPDRHDPAPGPEAAAIARSEAGRIARCLDELDGAHATAVRGAYLEGSSYESLAAKAGVPINTMRSWLRRSLIKLRECMER